MFPFFLKKFYKKAVRPKACVFCLLAAVTLLLGAAPAAADPLDNWHMRPVSESTGNLPQGMQHIYGVTYGSGAFVAAGWSGLNPLFLYGTIWTSPDGADWTERYSDASDSFRGVTYGNNTFVAAGINGTIMTSPDSANWTDRYFNVTKSFGGLTYGNNNFVVLGGVVPEIGTWGEGVDIVTSPDGINWTDRMLPITSILTGVTYGNNTFVAVGIDGAILTSPDGANWTRRTSGTSKTLHGVTYGGGSFVAVGGYGTILTSPDGVNWTSRTSPSNAPLGVGSNTLRGVTYGNGSFVAVGDYGTILTSPDGVNWTGRMSGTSKTLEGVTYGNNTFVVVGKDTVLQSDALTTGVTGTTTSTPSITSISGATTTGGGGSSTAGAGAISLQVGSGLMTVGGVSQEIDPGQGTAPVIVNGRTFVPIRAIVEAMGGTMGWNGTERKVTIGYRGTNIDLWIGSKNARVNGQDKPLDEAPFVSPTGRTMLPLRFVTENLGSQVQWDGANQRITITSGGVSQKPPTTTQPPATSTPAAAAVDFTGTWDMTVNGEAGHKLVLTQNGSSVTGYAGYDQESGHAFSGTVSGSTLSGKFHTNNPVTEWEFTVTMAADGNSFDGLEYYSDTPWPVHGVKAGAVSPQVIDFSGVWKLNVNGEDMGNDYCLVLQQNGNKVTGYCGYDPESGHAFTGTVSGSTLNGKFYTTNPVSEWEFKVTVDASGNSFEGTEYYSNPPWAVYGVRK